MTVTATLHAATADEVAGLGSCIHDSDFDWEEVRLLAEVRALRDAKDRLPDLVSDVPWGD